MAIRCLFKVTSVEQFVKDGVDRKVKLMAVYDPSIPEEQRFMEMTPSGNMEAYITNPEALKQIEIGKMFYVDLTPKE
jgi:hypothetical protein